tara:strand:+ start:1904 stop:2569 length:666 start_codon:yes stop_codon:yes gene_type:complete
MRKNSKLCINDREGKFLGVCAGFADFVGIEIWMVRLAYLASVIFAGWFMIPAYFLAWFFMDEADESWNEKNFETLKNKSKGRIAKSVEHFRNVDYRKKLYRNSRDRKLLGVCAGLADYLEVDATVVRIVIVITSLIPGSFVPLAYFIAYFILNDKPKPTITGKTAEYSKFRETLGETGNSSRSTFKSCARKFSSLHERLARMEAYVTSSKYKLDNEFKNIQ